MCHITAVLRWAIETSNSFFAIVRLQFGPLGDVKIHMLLDEPQNDDDTSEWGTLRIVDTSLVNKCSGLSIANSVAWSGEAGREGQWNQVHDNLQRNVTFGV